MSIKVNVYTEEFKSEAVKLARSRGSIKQASEALGVAKSTIYSWVDKAGGMDSGSGSKPASFNSTEALLRENKQLKKELSVLREEQAILKKAATYFARELG